jgi:hypothetical protein
MTQISSSSLFHFTRRLEYLIDILQNNFKPRYYPELFFLVSRKYTNRAIPMVCFCDIPLSQVIFHTKTYGQYGIGLTKKWAFRNKLNPVLYLQKESNLAISLRNVFTFMRKPELFSKYKELKDSRDSYRKVLRYIKNYEGDFQRDGKIMKNVKFYNEREWRYTPEIDENVRFWLKKEEYEDQIIISEANKKVSEFPLLFEPDDIRFIILKYKKEVSTVIGVLKERFPKKYEILATKILTYDQIKNDF